MGHTSVILRCPDALYAWYEAQLQPGATVEEVMLLALVLWTERYPGVRQGQLVEALSAHVPLAAPVPVPPTPRVPTLPKVPKAAEAKYRKKNQRRRQRR